MYINPFVAGALAVLIGELLGLIVYGFFRIRNAEDAPEHESEDDKNE